MSLSSDNAQIINQISQTITLPEVKDPQFAEKVEDYFKDLADTVNEKESGKYLFQEKGTSSTYFYINDPAKQKVVYRKVFDLLDIAGGDIVGGQTFQTPHEINNIRESAGIWAHCATTDGIYFTAGFPDVRLTDTEIIFLNSYTQPLTQCIIVANYIKES